MGWLLAGLLCWKAKPACPSPSSQTRSPTIGSSTDGQCHPVTWIAQLPLVLDQLRIISTFRSYWAVKGDAEAPERVEATIFHPLSKVLHQGHLNMFKQRPWHQGRSRASVWRSMESRYTMSWIKYIRFTSGFRERVPRGRPPVTLKTRHSGLLRTGSFKRPPFLSAVKSSSILHALSRDTRPDTQKIHLPLQFARRFPSGCQPVEPTWKPRWHGL